MVQCVICGDVLHYKNRGIGQSSAIKIGNHYVKEHNIDVDRPCLEKYLRCLLVDNPEEFIPLNCSCSEVYFLTAKDLAMHQLQVGCDIGQVGGARVSFFDDAPTHRHMRRQKVVSDEEVDKYYNFITEESNVKSIKMYDFKYERKIGSLGVNDPVLPPLSFLEHSVENIRKFIHTHNFLKDANGWTYGKMQLLVTINNTQNNSFLVTGNEEESEQKAIGAELAFIASPVNVNLMNFNNLLSQQKSYIENKLLESQENGSGWTLHSIGMVHLLLVLNPKNITSMGLRKLVGGMGDPDNFYMGDCGHKTIQHTKTSLILTEAEIDGNKSDDEMENGANEYDITDKFVNDEELEEDNISFYLSRNSKRRQEFDVEQQAGPSSKKTRVEQIIENYEGLDGDSIMAETDIDKQVERNTTPNHGREKKMLPDDLDDLEIDEGADMSDFTNSKSKRKIRDYTEYLKDYSPFDAFKPITENPESESVSEKNVYRRKNLRHCILKSILGGIYIKKYNKKDDPSYLDFVESLRNGTMKDSVIKFQFGVLLSFSETAVKGCYFNEVLHYVKSIEHAMNKTLYLNVFLEQKTVQSCSIYSDKKAFKTLNDGRAKEFKIRRPMKLIYQLIVPLPETKTVQNSINILIRKPSKSDPLLLHCVTITDLNKMFRVVSLDNKVKTNNLLYVCAGCTTSYVNRHSYNFHIKNCKTNISNKVLLLEKTYLRYDYRCARKRSFKSPFHIVFDVETKSCLHEETMEAEMRESKSKSTKERLRRLVLNSYAITVFADDLPNMESFTIYRSLTNETSIKFTMEKLPANLEQFVDEEDLYYRKWLEEKEISMYNFADLLVADLNLISQAMISFCNGYALDRNRALDETRLNKRALKQEANY